MNRFSGQALICARGGRVVFRDLDFAAGEGDALILTGANGSGKSSLLRLMAGLTPPFAGRLDWNGEPVADDPERHAARLHYVGHLDAVKPSLTVLENVSGWAALRGASRAAADDSATAALTEFGLDGLLRLPARLLSAGQRRRVALSRVRASPGRLWLLDEPTLGLDRASVAALENAIANHRREGGMVVMSTNVEFPLPGGAQLAVDSFAAPLDAALV